jgi:hypothetical protein
MARFCLRHGRYVLRSKEQGFKEQGGYMDMGQAGL